MGVERGLMGKFVRGSSESDGGEVVASRKKNGDGGNNSLER